METDIDAYSSTNMYFCHRGKCDTSREFDDNALSVRRTSDERSGSLWPLAHCLLATTLMYLEEMMIEYPNHQMLSVLKRSATDCGISMRELLEWGAKIKEKFVDDHAVVIQQNNELFSMMFEKILSMEKTAKASNEVTD